MKKIKSNIQYGSIKLSQVASVMIDGIGQRALLECVDASEFDRTKQMLKRIKHIDDNTSKASFKIVKDFENLLLFFFEWAKDNGYTQYYDFFILFYEELKSMIYEIDSPFYTTQKNIQNHLLFSIRNIVIKLCDGMRENYPNDPEVNILENVLSKFDIWGSPDNYDEDILPLKSAFMFLKKMIINKDKAEHEWDRISKDTNLYKKTERWCSGKQRPSWRELKQFLDVHPFPSDKCIAQFEMYKKFEVTKPFYNDFKDVMTKKRSNLHISDEFLYNPAEDELNDINYTYPAFSNMLFFAYFITNVADSMEKQNLISQEFRFMVRNGLRMFYRDFFSDSLSDEKEAYKDNVLYMVLTDFFYYGKRSNHEIYNNSEEEKLQMTIGNPFDKELSLTEICKNYSKKIIGEAYVFFMNWKLGEFYIGMQKYEKAIPFFVKSFEKGRYFAGKYMNVFLFETINFSTLNNEKKATIRRMVEFAEVVFPNGPCS